MWWNWMLFIDNLPIFLPPPVSLSLSHWSDQYKCFPTFFLSMVFAFDIPLYIIVPNLDRKLFKYYLSQIRTKYVVEFHFSMRVCVRTYLIGWYWEREVIEFNWPKSRASWFIFYTFGCLGFVCLSIA